MPPAVHLDVILPMTDNYMQDIVRKEKNYEFRRYRIAASVQRIWFYLNAPFSHIAYICEIDPARTRNPGDPPITEEGIGNAEFNTERGGEWERYDYAYRVRSVWRIRAPITLQTMREKYGLKGAPRGLVYVPPLMASDIAWEEQECIWGRTDAYSSSPVSQVIGASDDAAPTAGKGTKRKERSQSLDSNHKNKVQSEQHLGD
ncbi:hypothetical protein C8R47DRAFT_1184844 [Mycena vitilis]|nr:hypothetical protein C8R47DRAFT_1184844 [Mycena vitilis]